MLDFIRRLFRRRRKLSVWRCPPDYTRRMLLELDYLDYAAIQQAIACRQTFRCWPDPPEEWDAGESNIAGLAIAEICRGWMEFMDQSAKRKDLDDE